MHMEDLVNRLWAKEFLQKFIELEKENKPMDRFFTYTGQSYEDLSKDLTIRRDQFHPYNAIFVEPAYEKEFDELIVKPNRNGAIYQPSLKNICYFNGILVTSTAKYKETFKKPDVKCTIQEAIKAYNDGKTIKQKSPNGFTRTIIKDSGWVPKTVTFDSILNDEWYICP